MAKDVHAALLAIFVGSGSGGGGGGEGNLSEAEAEAVWWSSNLTSRTCGQSERGWV